MELVLRAAIIYFILLLVFTIAGKRQLAEVDTFRLILLLIISEATQQALLGSNQSVTGAAIVIVVLVTLEIVMSFLKNRFPLIEKFTSGGPLLLVDRGKILEDRLKRENVNREDILSTARLSHGLERFEEIEFAILEDSGEISVIPKKPGPQGHA